MSTQSICFHSFDLHNPQISEIVLLISLWPSVDPDKAHFSVRKYSYFSYFSEISDTFFISGFFYLILLVFNPGSQLIKDEPEIN